MNLEQAIKQRRSIRQYTDKVPADEDIKRVIEAATWAPSGLNNQPWKFKIVKDKVQREALAKFTKYGDIVGDAPVSICVFLDTGASYNRDKDIMAIGASVQNMLLCAQDIGLGTCWLGEIINRREEVQKYLKTDSDYELMAVVTLGYSDEEVTKGCRKKLDNFLC